MARPPLPLGEHGEISVAPKRGQWGARCRFRGFDGVTRKIEARWQTHTAARLALQDELRAQRGERTEMLRPESRFREAADIWMGKIRERREDSTADTYATACATRYSPSSASCASSSATSPSSTPSSPAWSGPEGLSSSRTARSDEAAARGQHAPADPRHRRRGPAAGCAPQGDPGESRARAGAHRVPQGPPHRSPARLDTGGTPPPARVRRHRQGRHPCRPPRPDPLRPRLGPAHRRDLRRPLDGPRPRRHPRRQRTRHAPRSGRCRPPERLSCQRQGPGRARRQERHGPAHRPAAPVGRKLPPRPQPPEFDPTWPVFASAGRDGDRPIAGPPTSAATSVPRASTSASRG